MSEDSALKNSSAEPSGDFSGSGNASNGSGPDLISGTGGASSVPEIVAPEKETSTTFELPHAGQRFVYVANPDENSVAVIDGASLAIHTVEAGAQPKFVQTLGGTDAAIVLNVASNDATIIRTSDDGTSATTNVAVQRGSNSIAVAPDGKHAVVYYDEASSSAGAKPGSFQDVSVLTLEPGKDASIGMTVGFRPTRVFFSSDGTKAFAATEDGVSILDFAAIEKDGPGIATTVSLGDTGTQATLDVSVTSDGHFALARRDGTSEIRLIDLTTKAIARLDVGSLTYDAGSPDAGAPIADAGAPPSSDAGSVDGGSDSGAVVTTPAPPSVLGPAVVTDLDLSPDGTYAMAVVRDRSAAVKIPIPAAFSTPSLAEVTFVPGELIGSVTLSPNGKYALLYTTAVDANERLTILPLAAGSKPASFQLRKSIDSVAIAPDDQTALIVHKKLAGDPNEADIDEETKLDRETGYSVVRLDTGFAKLQVTAAPLGPFATAPDGSQLFILFNQDPIREVQRVDLQSFLVQPIELGSPPISVGAVPTSKNVFVGQDHPDGRISFIDWKTGAVKSVTGFELNSRIQQ